MPEIVLWRCAALSAQLTESACERNATTAQATPLYRRGMLERCIGCPGVRALNRTPCDVLDADTTIERSKAMRPDPRQFAGSPRRYALKQQAHRPRVAPMLPLQAQSRERAGRKPRG